MRRYEAIQREDNERWDFTCTENGFTWPVGYCRGEPIQTGDPNAERYHDCGHATPAEAAACYRTYLIHTRVKHRKLPNQKRRCAICGEWTQHVVEIQRIGFFRFACPDHQSTYYLNAMIGEVGEIIIV